MTVRGVTPDGVALRPQVGKLTSGRMFNFGASELIVGNEIADRFDGMDIGNSIKFAGRQWKIVGHFDAGRSGFASDIWGDENQIFAGIQPSGFFFDCHAFARPKRKTSHQLKAKFDSDPRFKRI